MKLGDKEHLIAVRYCDEQSDVLLTTEHGRCIRFAVTDVREFASRSSTGVRGIRLGKGDKVVSMSILHQVDFTIEERDAYLKQAQAMRREDDLPSSETFTPLPQDRFDKMAAAEEFILTVSEKGFGKRSSAYEYRCTNRGGQGITTMDVTVKTGQVINSFPVKDGDDVMLVTNTGQLIRCPVHDIRIAGRRTQGVTLFRVSSGEAVVSVVRLPDDEEEDTPEETQQPSLL